MASTIDKEIGSRIAWLRENKGFSQKVAAERLGVAYSTYRNYEDGSRPSHKNINKIIEFYNIRRDWLLHGWGDPFNDISGPINAENSILAGTEQFYDEESVRMIINWAFSTGDGPLMQSLQSFIRMLHVLLGMRQEHFYLKAMAEYQEKAKEKKKQEPSCPDPNIPDNKG